MSVYTTIVAQKTPVVSRCFVKPRQIDCTAEFFPARRLVAAIVLQAVRDAYAKHTPDVHRQSAVEFLQSDHGAAMLAAALGKPA